MAASHESVFSRGRTPLAAEVLNNILRDSVDQHLRLSPGARLADPLVTSPMCFKGGIHRWDYSSGGRSSSGDQKGSADVGGGSPDRSLKFLHILFIIDSGGPPEGYTGPSR